MRGSWYVGFDEVGLWERLTDSDQRQRRDINDAIGQEQALQGDVAGLQIQVTNLKKAVFELTMTNSVLIKMLNESGALDLTVLKYRIEAEIEDMHEAQKSKTTATVTCARCGTQVPSASTTITANGAMCDRCANA